MKAVLFAAVASAQTMFCSQQLASNCTTAGMNCIDRAAYCQRRNLIDTTIPACATDMMTCAGTQCATGTGTMNTQTCSTCRDTCRNLMTNDTCSASSPTCGWVIAGCQNGPTPAPAPLPCSGGTRALCTGETGCFWMSYTSTICGASTPTNYCKLCNSTNNPVNVRSAIKNNQGKTCTWTASTPYTTAYTLTILDVGQNSDVTSCPAMTAASMDDETTLKNIVASGIASPMGVTPFGVVPFGTGATVACKQASGVAALVPSLFILGLIASLA